MRVIAHRGDTQAGPDNSLAAIEAALQLGVQGIEFDIQFDGDWPVVAHDPDVPGTPLADIVEAIKGFPYVTVFAEVKPGRLTTGRLHTALGLLAPIKSQTVITCYQRGPLQEARSHGWRIGWVVYELTPANVTECRQLSPEYGITDHLNLQGPLPSVGCEWVVYDVRDRETALALQRRGAHWVQSKTPRVLL